MMSSRQVVTVLLFLFLGNASAQDDPCPVVQVEQGLVQGSTKITPEGRQFYAYQGIPFGKAPTGPLRFKAPLPAEPWSGVLNATYDPPSCMQPSYEIQNPTSGVEDCLQLNVYTPQLPSNSSDPMLAVQVFIHGGAFITGDIYYDNYNPERYMNTDMVVVTIKYRLGALGFLATNDDAASGNWGLLDQNLALKWVQVNIAAFGGNPYDVTLTGQSAGSVSVLYQYLSPMSAGLFQRAIAESGSPLNPWGLQEDPAYYAKAMGEHYNCTTDNTTELIDCLRQTRAEDIVAHSFTMMIRNATFVFVPNVETSPSGQFLTSDPLVLFESGNFNQVPLQLGFTRDEGCLIFPYTFFFFLNVTDFTWDYAIPSILYVITDYRDHLVNISYAIKDQYYTGVDYENQTQVNIATIKWMSDAFIKSGVVQTAALVSKHNIPTFLYAYNYVSSQSEFNFTGEPDVAHAQELQYLWYQNITDPKDVEFGNRFLQLWTSFIFKERLAVSVGADDPWQPTPPGQYNYYDILESFTMRGNYDPDNMNFWWNEVPTIVGGDNNDV